MVLTDFVLFKFATGNRGGYQNNSRSQDNNSGGGQDDILIQRDTVFIQNLPRSVTNDDLEKHFGSIGIIKMDKKTNAPKIWIYKDRNTGEGKGEATVTYDDEAAATAAIEWFHGKLWRCNKIATIKIAYLFVAI